MNTDRNPRRRYTAVIGGVVSTALALAACSGGAATDTSAGNDGWSNEFAGTQLNVIAEATLNSTILQTLLPDFQQKTGIKVNLQQAPYDSLVQKAVLDFTTKRGTYDVLSIPYEYLGSFAEKKYIRPIDDYLEKPPVSLGKDFDEKDILAPLWKASSEWKSHKYGMPSNSAVMMMMYRKDLFENAAERKGFKQKYGYKLAPAQTWAQYRDIAEWFTRGSGEDLAGKKLTKPFYGVALTGKRHTATVLEWMNYAWGYGGGIFDKSGRLIVNGDANVRALNYERQLTAFAPPGYTSATWDEVTAELQQGIAAESITWGDTAGSIEDPSQSKVVGKMGYASIPVKAKGNKHDAHLGSWTYTVNANSQSQEAGYEFMAWALSKPVQLKLAKKGGLPALTSTFTNNTLTKSLPYWKQEYVSLSQSRSRPRIPQWGGISDAMALELSRSLSGQAAPRPALDAAQQKIESLMGNNLPVRYR